MAEWDAEIERLLARGPGRPLRRGRRPAPVQPVRHRASPGCATSPEAFASELARPMPRPPSPTARFGTRFHAWVESRFGQQDLFDPDELPGRADAGIDSDDDLRELVAAFEQGLFADRAPHAVEAPFALVLAGQVVRGRIDAVYAEQVADEPGFLVVDWKTGRREDADPLQLALYRLAWADLTGVPVERVRAGFYYVRSGPARRAHATCPDRGRSSSAAGSARLQGSGERDLDHPAEGLLPLLGGGLLAGDDVVGDGADRQRAAAVLRGQGVERAGLHLDGQHAVVDHPRDQLGAGGVEGRCLGGRVVCAAWPSTA